MTRRNGTDPAIELAAAFVRIVGPGLADIILDNYPDPDIAAVKMMNYVWHHPEADAERVRKAIAAMLVEQRDGD